MIIEMALGDRRQETGDRRQETGDRRQEIRDKGLETRDRRFIFNKKGIGPVVAIVLLVVVAVVAAVGFQTWYHDFSSQISSKVETQSSKSLNDIFIETLVDGTLYLKNPSGENLSIRSVKLDDIDCNMSGNFSGSIIKLNLSDCINKSATNTPEIVILTNNSLIEKVVYLKDKILGTKIWHSTVNEVDPFGDNSGVVLWQFEGNADDKGGKYNGTWVGTENYSQGKFGEAASFDGSNYIDTNLNPYNILKDEFSISFWWYNNDGSNYRGAIGYHTSDVKGFNLQYTNGWGWAYGNGSEWVGIIFDDKVLYKKWQFISFGYSKLKNKIYLQIDNNYIEKPLEGDIIHQTLLWIGKAYDSNDRYFLGNIDQVRIFNRSLTPEEVSILYHEGYYK